MRIVDSKVICPKCRSKDILLLEVWQGHSIQWEQIDGKFDREDGALDPGDPYYVEAKCKKCRHAWKLQNCTQIDDVIPEQEAR